MTRRLIAGNNCGHCPALRTAAADSRSRPSRAGEVVAFDAVRSAEDKLLWPLVRAVVSCRTCAAASCMR